MSDFIARRNEAMAKYTGWIGHDASDPHGPSGHAYGIHQSTRLTSDYREVHRKNAVDVKPQEVIDCIVQAGIKKWVLMGLHGYVGYLPMPRATQDVDIMVGYSDKKRAVKAISARWPMLEVLELSQVVRFRDGADRDKEGNAKPVIDLMLPWGKFQETILKKYFHVDEETQNHIPTLEAAIVAKYAALISPHRDIEKKEFDAGDMRRIIKNNATDIDAVVLSQLASEVWEGGANDILRFVELAITNKPFPIS